MTLGTFFFPHASWKKQMDFEPNRIHQIAIIVYGSFPKKGYPKMDGL